MLFFDKPYLHKLVESDEIQLREDCRAKHIEMAVLRHQVVCAGGKSTIHKFVIVRVGSDDAHTEMRVYELYVLLVEDE